MAYIKSNEPCSTLAEEYKINPSNAEKGNAERMFSGIKKRLPPPYKQRDTRQSAQTSSAKPPFLFCSLRLGVTFHGATTRTRNAPAFPYYDCVFILGGYYISDRANFLHSSTNLLFNLQNGAPR